MDFDAEFFNSAVLDVDDFPKADGMLILTYGTAYYLEGMRCHVFPDFCITEEHRFRRDHQLGNVDVEVHPSLHFDSGSFSFLHDFPVDDLRIE